MTYPPSPPIFKGCEFVNVFFLKIPFEKYKVLELH
jgi:hypothetical protein